MRKHIKLILFSILFIMPISVFADDFCRIKNPSDNTDSSIPYCDNTNSTKKTTKKSKVLVRGTLPSPYYSSVDEGYVTSVKNQNPLGTCWAFSAIATIESNALKNGVGNFDLSEAHVIYGLISAGYNDGDPEQYKDKYDTPSLNSGGVSYYAASYFFNNGGQLLESDYGYPSYAKKINSSDYPLGRQMLSLDTFELGSTIDYAACSTDEINDIKQKIYDYGAVNVFMYFDDSLFKGVTKDFYMATTSDSETANHGVTIVGWNDNMSKNLFNGATRDGAWIVKNSYGTNWSNDGYFYISYDDNFVCKYYASFSGVNNKTYDYTYKSTTLLSLSAGFGNRGTFYYSTRFSKGSSFDEKIKKVSVGLPQGATFNVYISPSNNIDSKDDWVKIGTGHSDLLSIKSVYVDDYLITNDYTIIVESIQDTSSYGVIPMVCSDDNSIFQTFDDGVNYFSSYYPRWTSLFNYNTSEGPISCKPIVYVYTDSVQNSGVYVKNNAYAKLINQNIIVKVDRGSAYTTNLLSNTAELVGKTYIKDKNDNYSSINVGTGSVIHFDDDSTYSIILKGDVTGDALINSADLVRIVKSLKKTVTLNDLEKIAADTNLDNIINSGDLVRIVKYLKGTANINIEE